MALPQAYFLVVLYWTCVEVYSPHIFHTWYLWDSLEITDELLFKKFHRKDGVESYNQFIVPFRLRKEILKNMHD
jgi:hypothetical protein